MQISKISIQYLNDPFIRAKVRIEFDNSIAINFIDIVYSTQDNRNHVVLPHIVFTETNQVINLVSITNDYFFSVVESQILSLFNMNRREIYNNIPPKQCVVSNITVTPANTNNKLAEFSFVIDNLIFVNCVSAYNNGNNINFNMPSVNIFGSNRPVIEFLNNDTFNIVASALYSEYQKTNKFVVNAAQTCVSLISAQGDNFNFNHYISRLFIDGYIVQIVSKDSNKSEIKLYDNSIISVISLSSKDVKNEMNAIIDYYDKIPSQNDTLKKSVMKQLSYINNIVYFYFAKNEDNNRTNYIISKIKYLANASSSLIMYADKKIFTADDKLVFSSEGLSDFNEFHPIISKEYVDNSQLIVSEDDRKRIDKNILYLRSNNIPYNENYSEIPLSSNTFLSSEKTLFENLIINYSFATIATTLKGTGNEEVFDKIYNKLNSLYDLDSILLPNEKSDMQKLKSGSYDNWVGLTWLYEYVAIFGWILGITEFPSQENQCNVEEMNKLYFFNGNINSLKSKIHIAKYENILQKADLLFRLQWAIDEAKIKHISLKTNLDKMIIHYQIEAFKVALNYGKIKESVSPFIKEASDITSLDDSTIKDLIIRLNKSQGKDKEIERMLVEKVIKEGKFFTIISAVQNEIKTITYKNGTIRVPIYTDMTELKKDTTISVNDESSIHTIEEIIDLVNTKSNIDGIVINPYSYDSDCTLILTTTNIKNILNLIKNR